jgi:hypothetical protein
MDGRRFDAIVQRMMTGRSRRAVIGTVVVSAGVAMLATRGVAPALAGKPCTTNLDCPKEQLCGTNRQGRRACGAANCPSSTVLVCKTAGFSACCEPGSTVCCQGTTFAECCPDTYACGASDANGYPACVPPA